MLKEQRKKEVKLRKNFFPLLLVTTSVWGVLVLIVFFVDPYGTFAIPLFLAVLLFSIFLTFSIIFANSRRGLIIATSLTLFLILRYFGIGNVINLLLIFGVSIAVEIYLSSR